MPSIKPSTSSSLKRVHAVPVPPSSRVVSGRQSSAGLIVRAGFLDFLQLPGSNNNAASSARTAALVQELDTLVSSTAVGTKANADEREEVEQLVKELRQFTVKNAARSKLLFGEFEVLYCSSPAAPGSPLADPSGTITPGAKLPRQTIEEDGTFTSSAEFKALGFMTGALKKEGSIHPAGPDSYQLELSKISFQSGLGGPNTREVDDAFTVRVLFLGDKLQALQIIPEDDSDEEDDTLLILRRINVEEEPEQEEPATANQGLGSLIFRGPKPQDVGAATIAERVARRQMAQEEERAGSRKVGGSAKVAVPQARGSKAAPAKPAAEQREAQAPREGALDGRGAEAQRRAAIQDLLASLSTSLKERQTEAKQAANEFKAAERSVGQEVKRANAARAAIEAAEAESQEAEEALALAGAARKEAAVKLEQARRALSEAKAKVAVKA